MQRNITLLLLTTTCFVSICHAQPNNTNFSRIHISHTDSAVKIDGLLDDTAWQHAEMVSAFYMKYPNDVDKPVFRTEVKITYDNKYLYVAFTCFDSGRNIIQSLKRDIGLYDNDGAGIVLDPQNLHTNGFFFVVNANNAQSEDQISLNQDNELSWSWDNKWFSATKRYTKYWTAEMAIPFKTLRYPSDKTTWGVNFARVDMKNNQYSVWSHVPVNFRIYNLGYTGQLLWDQPPPAPGRNMVVTPYVTGGVQSDRENSVPANYTGNAGLDSKIALNSRLNLDLTINPDFSQVEVDKQVTNLTRYDIFFPEKRSFFLENADIFGEYGIPGYITPFYSRRIGLDKDGNRIPIIGGLRLSGNITASTRIGVMDMQTGAKDSYAPENYAAISVNQNVFKRSVVKGYFLNRQGFLTEDEQKANPLDAWGRNAGLSFDYINESGKWNGWAGYHSSSKPGIKGANQFAQVGFAYNGRNFSNLLDLATVGTNYYTDMGYIQRIENYDAERDTTIRVGFKHIYNSTSYKIFSRSPIISRHTFEMENFVVFNPDFSFNERTLDLSYQLEFRNTRMLTVKVSNDDVNLLYPISFTDGKPLPAQRYTYTQAGVEYYSDTRKQFSYNMLLNGGSFYNGSIQTISGGITFRSRPHLNVIMQVEYDKLQFPGDYGNSELLLVSPKIEYNFTTKISWTTFLQYNTQENNFNINSRFQYRFRPMSDIYLVYTDNYYTSPLMHNKNRALVFKMNYWLSF